MEYEILSLEDTVFVPGEGHIGILVDKINSYDLPGLPWDFRISKVFSVKLLSELNPFPLLYFSRYRSYESARGFLSGVLYRFKYWPLSLRQEEYLVGGESWNDITLPRHPADKERLEQLDNLLHCIHYYECPNGTWYYELNRFRALSIRRSDEGGKALPVIRECGRYFGGFDYGYWFLRGVCYGLCPK